MSPSERASKSDVRADLGTRLLAAIDRIIAPAVVASGGDRLRRMRIAVAMLLLNLVLAPLGIVYQALHAKSFELAVTSSSLLATVVALAMARRRGNPGPIGHLLGVLLVLPPAVVALELGFWTNPPVGLVLMPVVVLLISGARAGMLWCGVSLVALVAMGLKAPTAPVEGRELATHWAVAMSFATVILVVLAYVFDRLRRHALQEVAQARDEARSAADVKSHFVANISHEIRTPMNGVLGMLDLALDTELTSRQREHLEIARSSGQSLLALLNDMLDLAKIEAGQLSIQVETFDLRELCESVLDQVAPDASRKGLELLLHYPLSTPHQVRGAPKRIRQVLGNLLSNAVKFTERGHVRVTMDHSNNRGVSWFECTVQDTGIGIPEDQADGVFERFKQVDSSTVRARPGTGLGLAIVRDLVELMQGELSLKSKPGEGTTLTFSLPMLVAREATAAPRASVPKGTVALVACTHPALRPLLREPLERWGLTVHNFENAAELSARLRASASAGQAAGYVVIDHRPGVLDGVELAREIREEFGPHEPRVVAIRAFSDRSDDAMDGVTWITRPIHRAALARAIDQGKGSERISGRTTRPPIDSGSSRISSSEHRIDSERSGGMIPEVVHGRVLVVEDNMINQKVVTRMLARMGWETDVAVNGAEGIDRVASATYDLVLMDIQMPVMDGITAAKTIREREDPGATVPIVALTAHAMEYDKQRCLDAGMDDYLTKPLQQAMLERVLRTFVTG